MVSRRKFLQAGTAATAVGITASALPSVAAETKFMPPSIAALKSMKSQAKPITPEERQARQERARELMKQNKQDAIFMIGGTSLVYFTGIRWWNSERLGAFILTAEGKPFYVCPAFEEDRLREQIGDKNAEVRTWQEDDDPYDRVVAGLRDRKIATGTLGMEERVTFVFSDGVAKHAPGLQVVSATPVTAGCRMIKSQHELDLMRLAAKVTITAYEAAWKALKPGMTQKEFEGLVQDAHQALGFQGGASAQVNEYSALPHGSLKPQTIKEGDIVLMDGGCTVEGYESDISRTFVLGGKPTDKMLKNFDIVKKAQATALATAKPGVPAENVDAAARKVITDAGYGPDYKYFTHRVGHGMGMDGHEWPYLVRGDKLPLQANMMFSDEPGIYIKGEFGVRLEDDMHITENGAELLTEQSPSITQPFGS